MTTIHIPNIPKSRWVRWLDSPWIGRVLALGVILSLIASVFSAVRVEGVTRCLANYNTMSQASTTARAKLNQEQIDATNTVILKVATATSRDSVVTALSDFTLAQEHLAVEKAQHPVPPPPSKVCR